VDTKIRDVLILILTQVKMSNVVCQDIMIKEEEESVRIR
jgi:hypothetical protein